MDTSNGIDYNKSSLQQLLDYEKSIDKEKDPERHRQILEIIAARSREIQAYNSDESHLNNLSIAHYIVGAIMVLFSCMPLIHMFIGLAFILGGDSMFSNPENPPPPDFFGWMFFLMGLLFFLGGQAASISVIVSGNYLKKRKNYIFSFVIACVSCLFMPFGTVLGVLTIITLSRENVKSLYAQAKLNHSVK